MEFKTFYWLSHYGIFNKSQYTIISKYGKRTRQVKFKGWFTLATEATEAES